MCVCDADISSFFITILTKLHYLCIYLQRFVFCLCNRGWWWCLIAGPDVKVSAASAWRCLIAAGPDVKVSAASVWCPLCVMVQPDVLPASVLLILQARSASCLQCSSSLGCFALCLWQ